MFGVVAVACARLTAVPVPAEPLFSAGSLEERELRGRMALSPESLPMNRVKTHPVAVRAGCDGWKAAPVLAPVRLDGGWTLERTGLGPVAYEVPESIHVALMRAGRLPDPNVGTNVILARLESTEYDWLCTRDFTWSGAVVGERDELVFEGVCDRCEVTLNGERLGTHAGMFGGPDYDVTGRLRKGTNRLQVRLLRARPYWGAVVFSCSYGWHYSQVVPLGIWRSVSVRRTLAAKFAEPPFVTTRKAQTGEMRLFVKTRGEWNVGPLAPKLELRVSVEPKNFVGRSVSFSFDGDGQPAAGGDAQEREYGFDFTIPDPHLWWPHGYGAQPLYRLRSWLMAADGRVADVAESTFGIRELAYEHAPAHPDYYKILLSVNGRRICRKGTNWCTTDALMRFTPERYRRFLVRAKEQGVNWLRAWGLGLEETDEFYDLCDEMGILVRQECPTGNGSHLVQDPAELGETMRRTTRRLRNHPSLVSWCGGNEVVVKEADYPVLCGVLGREVHLGDGTRLYLKQEENVGRPGFAICHSHIRWSGDYPENYLDRYGSTPNSLGEWGADTLLNVESLVRTVGREEAERWPVDPDGAVAYRTAMFNNFNAIWRRQDGTGASLRRMFPASIPDKYTGERKPDSDLNVAWAYARTFYPEAAITNLRTLVRGSQLAQAMCLAPTIGNLRSFWPDVPGFSYYKLNNVGPNGSWAVVDWYGSPTIAYWWVRAFMNPVLAAVRLPTFDFHCKKAASWKIPVRLLDETEALSSAATARVRIYDDAFDRLVDFSCGRSGERTFDRREVADGLRFVVAEVLDGGKVVSRTWTPLNYDKVRGSLFAIAKTHLGVTDYGKGVLEVRNVGSVPAVGVEIGAPSHSDILHLSDNWFWLEPGEARSVTCSYEDGVVRPVGFVRALNAD